MDLIGLWIGQSSIDILYFYFSYMNMFNFGVSKSSACYNLELIAERFISQSNKNYYDKIWKVL